MPSKEDLIDEAMGHREMGDAKAAISVLEGAIETHAGDGELHFLLGKSLDSVGRERDAIPHYEQAVELGLEDDEDLADAYIALGSNLRAAGEYDKAIEVLNRALERFPGDRAAEAFLALAIHNSGDSRKAVEMLVTSLAETSGDERVRAYRGALTLFGEDVDAVY